MPECGHDAVGDDGSVIYLNPVEHIESDRAIKVGRVEVDQLVGTFGGNEGKGPFGEVAVGVEEGDAAAHRQVLGEQVEQGG